MVSLLGGVSRPWGPTYFPDFESRPLRPSNLRILRLTSHHVSSSLGLASFGVRKILNPVVSVPTGSITVNASIKSAVSSRFVMANMHMTGENGAPTVTVEKAANIRWHESSIGKPEREQLLQQKGCVIWITGLSGSGKSTLACAITQALHARGKLTYILDGDNVRHGLNKDLTFKAEDRVENIRRVGEVAKLFADAGIICIASLISPYCKDRDACRALLQEGDFIEVFMDVPLHVCEARDPKGLYKLARAGKIKGFTGIDDPYEPPMDCEIALTMAGESCPSPFDMAETVVCYLEERGYLRA